MDSNLLQSLQKIRTGFPKINQQTDRASSVMKRLEAFLRENGAGVSSDVCFWEEDADGSSYWLEYSRADSGGYGFQIRRRAKPVEADGGVGESLEIWPWHSAPRELRLWSFQEVGRIVEDIARDAEILPGDVDSAADEIEKVLDSLPKKPTDDELIEQAARAYRGEGTPLGRPVGPTAEQRAALNRRSRHGAGGGMF